MKESIRRLGDPVELTRQLQRSVPMMERILMGRVPLPRAWERMEVRETRLWNLGRPMTMGHSAILLGVAGVLPYVAGVLIALRVRPAVYVQALADRPGVMAPFNVLCVGLMLFGSSARLIGAVSIAGKRNGRRIIAHGGAIVAGLMGLMFACVNGVGQRTVTLVDVAIAGITGVGLVMVLWLVGTFIGRLRREYDAWLAIEIGS